MLSFGGFMGMGNKLFAMPWEAFELSATENKLILNVEKEKLKTAPGFEKGDKWPDFSDTIWGEIIYNYYDYVYPWNSQDRRFGVLVRTIQWVECALPRAKAIGSSFP